MRAFFAPEVVQTSTLDCGPAALKSLLEGFGIKVSYGRLREACQTGLDGTSIDTMEAVANELGLEAEQIMLPVDHLLLPEAHALPAIVVVVLPTGATHFVVAWRRIGNFLQVMDPAVGRRWVTGRQFAAEVYRHSMLVGAEDWREFAIAGEFQAALEARVRQLGMGSPEFNRLVKKTRAQPGFYGWATFDAAVRLLQSLANAGGLPHGAETVRLLRKLSETPTLIPQSHWSTVPAPTEDGNQVLMSGAVLVRVKRKPPGISAGKLSPELAAAIETPSVHPARELARALGKSGLWSVVLLVLLSLAIAAGTLIEALLFRALLAITADLHLAGQRLAAIAAILLFSLGLLLFEAPLWITSLRLGRHLETVFRVLFLEKIPKLGDRYFQSRLTSDMAERSHATHRLRQLPYQARQLLSALFQLAATGAGIGWLDPPSAPFVLLAIAAALVPAVVAQPLLIERDLRARTHSAGLMRFYLDAMLGLFAIRAHGAERVVRQEHEKLLGKWALAALRLQRLLVGLEALQLTSAFVLVAALVLTRPQQGAAAGQLLLLAYWALNLPVLGQEIGSLARQYPAYRNLTLRLLEPLGAAEEPPGLAESSTNIPDLPPTIAFRQVSAVVSGHTILCQIDCEIAPGSKVAIVGPSGAGKSSLVGLLLGWLQPSSGEILVDGAPLDCHQLRLRTAWVDPAVQLWNQSLLANLTYGSTSHAPAVGEAIDAAMLRRVLETLPAGLQTNLGEGGALVSGGEGQRVRFARSLLRDQARLVILDEPFRGLDREKRRELLRRARDWWRGATLLCITHDLAETEIFDRVIVVEGGRIVEQGSPLALRARGDSRYAQLLAAEQQIRQTLWSAGLWRRVVVNAGQIVEELPTSASENPAASEVA